MNKELEKALIDNMNSVTNYVKSIEQFNVESAPLIVQEILSIGMMYAVLQFIFFMLLLLFCIYLCKFHTKWLKDDFGVGPQIIFPVFGFGLSIYGFYSSIYYMIFIHFAPRLYVLETLTKLMS